MTDMCGDFAIFLVPNELESGLGKWDRYPPFVSQHVPLCTISRFSGQKCESGQSLPWRSFGRLGSCAGVFRVPVSFFPFRPIPGGWRPRMAGVNNNVREAPQGLARGRCHWAKAVAEISFVALSEAKGRSSEAEILRCVWNDGDMWRLCIGAAGRGRTIAKSFNPLVLSQSVSPELVEGRGI